MAGLRVKITHGCFQADVAKHDLEIAHDRAILKGVRGESVAQAVWRQAIQSTGLGCLSDCSLDIGFVTAPAHRLSCAGVQANAARREQPSPSFGQLGCRVFLGQEPRERDRNALSTVSGSQGLCPRQLVLQRGAQASRNGHHAILVPFGSADVKT